MRNLLDDLFVIAGRLDAIITADDIASWPRAVKRFAENSALLRRAPNARHLTCDHCDSGHVEPVDEIKIKGNSTRHFIFCPDAGRVFVDASRLMQWTIDGEALASTIQSALGAQGQVELLVDDRIWRLGTLMVSDRVLSPVMLRGAYLPDTDQILSNAMTTLAADKVILIVVGDHGKQLNLTTMVAAIVPTHPTFSLRGDRLRADMARIETSVPEHGGHVDGPLFDDGALLITYRGKSCKFGSRSRAQFALLKRICRRPGHPVEFDVLRDEGDIFGEYACEDSSIKRAVSRLRDRLRQRGMKRLADCLSTGTVERRSYAVVELSRYDSNAH